MKVFKITALIFFTTAAIFSFLRTVQSTSSPIPIHPWRAKLLKDALSWVTFRRSGQLVSDTEVWSLFLEPVMEKYRTSKSYRAFVIAFQTAILPQLVLKEGEDCRTDRSKYQHPKNNSVTWYSLRTFVHSQYHADRSPASEKFCDYRKGLVCFGRFDRCSCPTGSSMQPLSPGSPVQRCVLDQNEVCSLIDLDHGRDPKHSILASHLYHLIFNFEKPVGCRDGTQCRFKPSDPNIPRCYANNDGPWYPYPGKAATPLDFGEECALGLYADTGMCRQKGPSDFGIGGGFVCYDFGLPSSQKSYFDPKINKIGFCFYDLGTLGLARDPNLQNKKTFCPFYLSFVHPRLIPLRGAELRQFYRKYAEEAAVLFNGAEGKVPVEVEKKGARCSVRKTTQMETAWKYFFDLREGRDIPDDQDFHPSATKTELEAKQQAVIDLGKDSGKVCRVYYFFEVDSDYFFYDYNDDESTDSALKCVVNGTLDGDGNDGVCEENDNSGTRYWARGHEREVEKLLEIEEKANNYDVAILLENPEFPCDPKLGPMSSSQAREYQDVLEKGYCPENSVCGPDFSDARGIFEERSCELKRNARETIACHDVSQPLGECEAKYLEGKIQQKRGHLEDYSGLQEGERCYFEVERALRSGDEEEIKGFNGYQVLDVIEREQLCDAGQDLECVEGGTCEEKETGGGGGGGTGSGKKSKKKKKKVGSEWEDASGSVLQMNVVILVISGAVVAII